MLPRCENPKSFTVVIRSSSTRLIKPNFQGHKSKVEFEGSGLYFLFKIFKKSQLYRKRRQSSACGTIFPPFSPHLKRKVSWVGKHTRVVYWDISCGRHHASEDEPSKKAEQKKKEKIIEVINWCL